MGTCWNVYLVPERGYRPLGDRVAGTADGLVRRLGLKELCFSDESGATSVEAALTLLNEAAENPEAAACVRFRFDGSEALFGWDPQAADDDRFWAETLEIAIYGGSFPLADWEDAEARCPACGAAMASRIMDRLDKPRGFIDPIACGCGVRTPLESLILSEHVHVVGCSIGFTGNKGWYGARERGMFKDGSFLPALEDDLGSRLDIVAVSS